MSNDPFERRLPQAFGKVLRRRRIERKMSLEALAMTADLVAAKAVETFESGDAPPSLTDFFKIAEALHEKPVLLFADVVAEWRGDSNDPLYKSRPSDFERLFRLGYHHKIGDFREQDRTYGSIPLALNVGGKLNEHRYKRGVALLDTVCIYVRMEYEHFDWKPGSKEVRP